MLTHLTHDFFYGWSLALNTLLIALIVTKTPSYLRSYSIVLLYLSIVELSTATSSLLIFRRVMSTPTYVINAVCGSCRHWRSPRLCFSLYSMNVAGLVHYAIMIAFCSCYRYYVLASSRGEPHKIRVPYALVPLLDGKELEKAMNESHPEYDLATHREKEMLL
ncbi:hypothetical protein PENTCL1PPCAC_16573, partial [Pristionchus entomophagus]